MSKPSKKKQPKIVDYGSGPHLYAGEVANMFFDGATVTLTLGNLEVRVLEKDATPTSPPVLSVCGKVTFTPEAAIKVVGMLNNLLSTLEAQQDQAPSAEHVN